jgi:hypothetical protein
MTRLAAAAAADPETNEREQDDPASLLERTCPPRARQAIRTQHPYDQRRLAALA